MQDNFSQELIAQIEAVLKKAVQEAFDAPNVMDNCEQAIVQKVNSKITTLSGRGNGIFTFPQQTEVKSMSCTPVICNNGVVTGEIVVEHCQKQDVHRYGGPGYPGKENGQLCEYPKGSRRFYKWDDYLCKWKNIYHSINRDAGRGQSWSAKLTGNAAFEPWWGNNTSGGDYLKSDRKRNGADDLWGDPGVRSYMGTFKQVSADVMKSIYSFTLDLKSAIGHYEKISDALGFGDKENSSTTSIDNNAHTVEEELKVKIKIERVRNHFINMSFGMRQESSVIIKKDTLVYSKDSTKIQENVKRKNEELIKKRKDEFNNN